MPSIHPPAAAAGLPQPLPQPCVQAKALWRRDRAVLARTIALQPPAEFRRLCGFTHIFSGGYAAGYYG